MLILAAPPMGEADFPHCGSVEAHVGIDMGDHLVVPYALLPPSTEG
ncbi:MAG: hypothetical protein GY929_12785 [Actinomycetia bacterium]|nr:hypothetical protein [Actinomycetes bacterium]